MKNAQKKLPTDQLLFVRLLMKWADDCRAPGRYPQAESLYRKALTCPLRACYWLLAMVVLAAAAFSVGDLFIRSHAAGLIDNPTPVTIVSAASLDPAVAPESIVYARGSQLATQTVTAPNVDADPNTPGIQLPTSLGGTEVKVNHISAELFSVSPTQVVFLLPKRLPPGAATVVVTANEVVSRGTAQVSEVAPALYTANGDGQGAPVGYLQRIVNGRQLPPESLVTFDPATGSFGPRPIRFGPVNEEIFVVLDISGIRGAAVADADGDGNYNEMIHLAIDGQELAPDYAGPQFASFASIGRDQMNVKLPRSLIGRGRVGLSVTATGFFASNTARIEIGGAVPPAIPQMNNFSPTPALAGEEFTIDGANFSSVADENTVEIIGSDAQAVVAPVTFASSTQLKVRVPFGADSGIIKVTVRTSQGDLSGSSQTPLALRTSVSGFVQDNNRRPIPGVPIRLVGHNISTQTDAEGVFSLADTPPSRAATIEIGGATPGGLPFPAQRVKLRIRANRDNLFQSAVELQPAFDTLAGTASSFAGDSLDAASFTAARETTETVQGGKVILELPQGAIVRFPDGTTGNLTLTTFGGGRTPFDLPVGHYSSTIAQLAPFQARITPGGKLIFPNTDNLPAGTTATLFRFDQRPESPTLGSFIADGSAMVSADGRRIETGATTIKETSYHFVSVPRPTATLVGRVVEANGRPRRLALVQARGQSTFTDGLGGFVLRNVPVIAANDQVTVEVSYLRATRRVDRTQQPNVPVAPGQIVKVPVDIPLPDETSNRPPTIIAPANLVINQGVPRNVNFITSDPDGGQPPVLNVAGVDFATVTPSGNNLYTLRLTPGADRAGDFRVTLSATDVLGAQAIHTLSLRVNRAPSAQAQQVITTQGSAKVITLVGSDPDNDPLRFTIVSQPSHGKLNGTLTGAGPNFTYTPDAGFSGGDSFTFKASDGFAESNTATVAITITPCAYSIPPTSPFFEANGGSGSVSVSTTSGCTWMATESTPWITITSGSSGGGNGTVSYSVAANTGPQRTGAITVAGQTHTVTQSSGCVFTVSPPSQTFAVSGGIGSVSVTAGAGCVWKATDNATWITITSGSSGSGNGTVSYSVAANTGPQRTGAITVAGHTHTATQSGCSYSISPTSQPFPASGATAGLSGSVSVSTTSGCSWTATSNAGWITVTSGGSGSGNGKVTYSVKDNGGCRRTGTITIAGKTFTVTQSGIGTC